MQLYTLIITNVRAGTQATRVGFESEAHALEYGKLYVGRSLRPEQYTLTAVKQVDVSERWVREARDKVNPPAREHIVQYAVIGTVRGVTIRVRVDARNKFDAIKRADEKLRNAGQDFENLVYVGTTAEGE
jgi:hypothetical protein